MTVLWFNWRYDAKPGGMRVLLRSWETIWSWPSMRLGGMDMEEEAERETFRSLLHDDC